MELTDGRLILTDRNFAIIFWHQKARHDFIYENSLTRLCPTFRLFSDYFNTSRFSTCISSFCYHFYYYLRKNFRCAIHAAISQIISLFDYTINSIDSETIFMTHLFQRLAPYVQDSHTFFIEWHISCIELQINYLSKNASPLQTGIYSDVKTMHNLRITRRSKRILHSARLTLNEL